MTAHLVLKKSVSSVITLGLEDNISSALADADNLVMSLPQLNKPDRIGDF